MLSRETANDRFKRGFGHWMWGGVMVAAAFHFALFQYFPTLTARDISTDIRWTEPIPPPRVKIPPPPERIRQPQIPVPGGVDVDETVTINPISFDSFPVGPPPPLELGYGRGGETFVVYTVPPRLRDRRAALSVVEQNYPSVLKQAGIGGTVTLQAYVDRTGRVRDARVLSSSGMQLLDDAALDAMRLFEFTPALNRDTRVAVWIQQLIIFEVK